MDKNSSRNSCFDICTQTFNVIDNQNTCYSVKYNQRVQNKSEQTKITFCIILTPDLSFNKQFECDGTYLKQGETK